MMNPLKDLKKETILECVRSGKPLSHIPVLDLHTHMGSSSRFYYVPLSSVDNVKRYFNRYGIDHALTFALSATTDPEVKNNGIYRWCRKTPGFFSCLTALHAAFPNDWQGLLEDGEKNGSRGIKLIANYQGIDELDVDWSPAFEFARERGWIVLNHDWKTEEHLASYAECYPDITFLIGHPTLPMSSNEHLLTKYDNIYQSTCAAFVVPGFSIMSTEGLYHSLPLEKILFGSDTLDLDLGTAIGPIAYANIPEKAKEMILGGNALNLARKIGWDLSLIEKQYVS